MKNAPFPVRFGYALSGIASVWHREKSFRTQTIAAAIALVVTAILRPGWLWGAAIVMSIALVLALELLNAALESLIDRVHPEIHPAIRIAKDAAAGAVLIASAAAACVGAMMLLAVLSR
jgi:undecaprenol kinase